MCDEDANNEDENAESSNYIPPWLRNRKKLNEHDLKNLHPHIRSKYLAVHTYMLFIVYLLQNIFINLLAYEHIITFTISHLPFTFIILPFTISLEDFLVNLQLNRYFFFVF